MERLALYAGLDYSDAYVQVCLLDREGKQIANRGCANDWRAVQAFVDRQADALRPVRRPMTRARYRTVGGTP